MEQEFQAEFPLNPNNTVHNDADWHGAARAEIQGLNQMVLSRDAEIHSLKSELEQLKQLVDKLANAQH